MAANDTGSGKAGTGKVDLDVAIEKDTLTASEHTTGLAGVLAGRAVHAAADDIGDLLIGHTNNGRVEVLVASDADFANDREQATLLRFQLAALRRRIEAAEIGWPPAPGGDAGPRLAAGGGVLSALTAVPGAISLVSKLVARQYVTSGTALEAPDLGIDLRIAGSLGSRFGGSTTASVQVERFWTPVDSETLQQTSALAQALVALADKVAAAEETRQAARARLDAATTTRASAWTALTELCGKAGEAAEPQDQNPSPWRHAWDHVSAMAALDVGQLAREAAAADRAHAGLQSLQEDVESFLALALTPTATSSPPLVRAVRADWLGGDPARVLVYARVLRAGVDQVQETKLGPDRRYLLAGASVEFAALSWTGAVMFAGVYDNLWGGSMKLNDVGSFTGQMIDYAPVRSIQRVDP